jgi:hypothetical protein
LRYALLVFLAALLLAILTHSVPARGEGRGEGPSDKSIYVPSCVDLHPKPRRSQANQVTVMTGPAANGENLFVVGYTRRLKEDLSLGFQTIFSDKGGYRGTALGLIYHFGDPE